MKQYFITNKEVYTVSYTIEAENEDEAIRRWEDEHAGEEVDIQYFCDLGNYTDESHAIIQEFIKT